VGGRLPTDPSQQKWWQRERKKRITNNFITNFEAIHLNTQPLHNAGDGIPRHRRETNVVLKVAPPHRPVEWSHRAHLHSHQHHILGHGRSHTLNGPPSSPAFIHDVGRRSVAYVLGESEACLATKIDEGDTTHAADRTQEKQLQLAKNCFFAESEE